MEATCLRLYVEKSVGMRRRLNDSGVEGAQALELPPSGVSVSMLARYRYFRELIVVVVVVVVVELLSLH